MVVDSLGVPERVKAFAPVRVPVICPATWRYPLKVALVPEAFVKFKVAMVPLGVRSSVVEATPVTVSAAVWMYAEAVRFVEETLVEDTVVAISLGMRP